MTVLSTTVAECFQNVTKIELPANNSCRMKSLRHRATRAAVAHGCNNVFFGRSLEQTKRARPADDITGNSPKRYQNRHSCNAVQWYGRRPPSRNAVGGGAWDARLSILVDVWDTFDVTVLSTAVAECFQNVTKIELPAKHSCRMKNPRRRATQAAVAHGCKNVFFGRSLEQTKRARPLDDISGNDPKRYQNRPSCNAVQCVQCGPRWGMGCNMIYFGRCSGHTRCAPRGRVPRRDALKTLPN